jgi:hypothetical protein
LLSFNKVAPLLSITGMLDHFAAVTKVVFKFLNCQSLFTLLFPLCIFLGKKFELVKNNLWNSLVLIDFLSLAPVSGIDLQTGINKLP